MSPMMLDHLNAWAAALTAGGVRHFLQTAALAVLLALIDAVFGRRLGPAWRCGLWLLFFVKLVLPPQFALPSSPAFWLGRTAPPAAVPMPVVMAPMKPVRWEMDRTLAALPREAEARGPRAAVVRPSWRLGLVAGWLVAAAGLAFVTQRQRRRWGRVLRGGAEAPAWLRTQLARARAEVGLRRDCRIRVLDTSVGPLVVGLWRPTIYLPRQLLAELTVEQLHAVLLHEVLHVKRGDLWVTAVQGAAQIVFFYHPAVWWVNRHLARLREEATDRAVLWHRAVDPRAYSLALVSAAEFGLAGRPTSLFALGVIETKSQLRKRIQMNLNQPRSRRTRLGRSGLLSLAVVGLVLVPMAPAGLADPGPNVPAGFTATDAPALTAEIDAASERIFAAFNRRDRDAYVEAFTADAAILAPGVPLQAGHVGVSEGYLRVPPGLIYEKIRWRDRQCYRLGKWLVDTGLAELQFRLKAGAPVMADPRAAFTLWEQSGRGDWRVKLLAWNGLPQAPDFSVSAPARACELVGRGVVATRREGFDAVLAAEETFHRAFDEQRPADAAAYYADGAILFCPGTHPLRGYEAIRRFVTQVPAGQGATQTERRVASVEGDDRYVLVVNLFRWTFRPAGATEPVTVAGKGVHLWERGADGAWKILFDLPNPSQPVDDGGRAG